MSLFYDPWTIIPAIILSFCYLFRSIPPFSWIWSLFKWVCVIMLIGFVADRFKKDAKEWWNKD